MRYQNFNVSIYCPVGNLVNIKDFSELDRKFQLLEKNVKVGKVYLETFRGETFILKEQMLKVRAFFEEKGIDVSGGITPVDYDRKKEGGFHSLCYSSSEGKELLRNVVALTAELFDEFILDDFYFNNCRCDHCLEEKGNRSWSEYRLSLMQDISENIILKTARDVNPNVKVIIKYPNWYEHYQETGYNLEEEPKVFDYIYAGTETRNPTYTQQHLPKYLSYFIMRYLENVAPNRNLGGWFDPYECTYNLTSYLDQAYLTLFAKAKEAMLFSLGSLIDDKAYTTFPPAVGQAFEDIDKYFSLLGNPVGVSTYLPYHSYGEDYLHNYIGMCGIPLEPYPYYPEDSQTLFLTENAVHDKDIVNKMKNSLKKGAEIIVTSGFVAKLGSAFHEFMHILPSDKKALVNRYMYSKDGGITFSGCAEGAREILIPQIKYFTNDVWQLAGGYGEDNNYPVLLKSGYSNGSVYVLTVPDNPGDLYHYPNDVITAMRSIICKNLPVSLEAPSKIALFTFDNHTFILRSFLPYLEKVSVSIPKENIVLEDLENSRIYHGLTTSGKTKFSFDLSPGVNYVLKYK